MDDASRYRAGADPEMRIKIMVFERYEAGNQKGRKVGIRNFYVSLFLHVQGFPDVVGVAVEDLRGGLWRGKIEGSSPEMECNYRAYEEKEGGCYEKGEFFWKFSESDCFEHWTRT